MGKIVKVSGPLVVATGMADANMSDVVRVGEQRLDRRDPDHDRRRRLHPGLRRDLRPRPRR